MELQNPKLYSLEEMAVQRKRWRETGDQVVFTNGCFDILHAGHVYYLQEARRQGDRLIVGLNSDQSLVTLGKRDQPIQPEEDRAFVLGGLESVDAIVIFEEETPAILVDTLIPDILVKGADYSEEEIVGAHTVTSHGGKVMTIPLLSGRSTTIIAQRIKN